MSSMFILLKINGKSLVYSIVSIQPRKKSLIWLCGEMAEWLNAAALKAAVRATGPWVQIPLSPPFITLNLYDQI